MHSAIPQLTVNLSVIKKNYQLIQSICGTSIVAVSAKADCYGLGATAICPALASAGCKDFFVFNATEGRQLRAVLADNINIYVLAGPHLEDAEAMYINKLTPVINHLQQAYLWQKTASKYNKQLPAVLYFDTSLNRYALTKEEYEYIAANINEFANINVGWLMSHFSSADDPSSEVTSKQAKLFNQYASLFPQAKKCLANSGGIIANGQFHLDMVRTGAIIYGLNPRFGQDKTPTNNDMAEFLAATSKIQNPIKLEAPIIQIFDLKAGQSVGYNCTFTASKSCKIATAAIGYADGISVASSNNGSASINGHIVPIIGRVSMDLVTLDVTNIPQQELALGMMAEFIGRSISADMIAKSAGTIGYEVLTNIGKRVKKLYTNS